MSTEIECEVCGKKFKPRSKRSRYCSRPCLWEGNKGRVSWNAGTSKGWSDERGCRWVYVRENGRGVSKLEHRMVMERHLGRPLSPEEVVHHINGNPADNQLENLQVVTWGEHTVLHHAGRIQEPAQRELTSIFARYREEAKRGRERERALREALQRALPVLKDARSVAGVLPPTHPAFQGLRLQEILDKARAALAAAREGG